MIDLTDGQKGLLKKRLLGLCAGAYMGSFIGAPWKRRTWREIFECTGEQGVQGPQTPISLRKLPERGDLIIYRTSDGWQQFMAVGLALRRARKDRISLLMAHAIEHVRALEEDRFGWDHTTITAVESLRTYFRTDGIGGRHPEDPVEPNETNQSGTGPLMKAALMALPFLFAQLGNDRSFNDEGDRALHDLYQLGRMTHSGDAVLVTIPYVVLLAQFLDPRRPEGGPISFPVLRAWQRPMGVAHFFTSHKERMRAIRLCDTAFAAVEVRHPELFNGAGRSGPPFLPRPIVDVEGVNQILRGNAYDPSKIGLTNAQYALAQALLLDSPGQSLDESVLEAINAGGDVDTFACIRGAKKGAFCGWSEDGLPDWWKEHDLPAREFADKLFEDYVLPMLAGA